MAPEKKRKRPQESDSATPKKKSNLKKTPDAAAAAKKTPFTPSSSTAAAVPTVAALRARKDEESSFPRGGASALTPLEYKEITHEATRDVLFETDARKAAKSSAQGGDEGQVKKKRQHDRKKAVVEKEPKEPKELGPKVEGLSFKRLAPGTLVLGCVSQINPTDVALSLPNNLTGYIPFSSISEKFTSKLEALVEDSSSSSSESEEEEGEEGEEETKEPKQKKNSLKDRRFRKKKDIESLNLALMFRLGQYLRAYVVHSSEDIIPKKGHPQTNQKKARKRIELSLYPSLANIGLSKNELDVGITVQASIASVEDHGLVMDLGIEGDVKGFLSLKELGQGVTKDSAKEGQVLLCTVTGLSSNGKTVKISADLEQKPSKNKKLAGGKGKWWVSEAPTIDAFLPGTGVEVLVTGITQGGIVGKVMGMLDAVVDFFHVAGWEEQKLEDKIKTGTKIKARITSTFPRSDPKKIGLSVLPHILHLTPVSQNPPLAALPIATILGSAKVIHVEPKTGLFLDVGVPNIPGFVHISRISSDSKIESLARDFGEYKVGSVHQARVIGFNEMDGVFLLSMEKRVLEQPFLRVEDIKVGEIVKSKIERVLERGGLIVNIADGISGVVDATQLSDVKLKNPEKKFKVGAEVKARVLSTNLVQKKVRMTLKKSLLNSDAPIIDSFEVATPGMQVVGTLIKIFPAGAIVQFYSGVCGFLPVYEMSEAHIQDPREHFHVGQSVNVHVVSVDTEARKIRVSCKDPESFGKEQRAALKNLQPGTIVSGIVSEKSKNDLIVEIEGLEAKGLKGVLVIGQMADGSQEKNKSVFKKLRAGQTLVDLVVLKKSEKKRLVTLSMKPSLVKAAKEGELVTKFEDVPAEGKIVKGYVNEITLVGVFVGFGGDVSGLVLKRDLPLENQSLPDFGYFKYQSISPSVWRIDHDLRRFTLWLKPAETTKVPEGKGAATPADENARVAINPIDEDIESIDQFVPGKLTKAKVLSVQATQINVQLADQIRGRIDVSQVFDSWDAIENKKAPLQHIKRGEILPVKVIGYHDARNYRFLPISHRSSANKTMTIELSAKPSDVRSEGLDVLTFDKIMVRTSWPAFVNNIAENCIWVNISPDVRGRIRILDLSDDVSKLNDVGANFPVGSALKCTVLSVDSEHKKLDLSARNTSNQVLKLEELSKGMVIPARITKVTDRRVIVQMNETIVGTVNLTDLADDFSEAKPENYKKNYFIRVFVLDVDKPNKRITLSTRPSKVLSSSLPVRDPEIQKIEDVHVGDVRRGFVKNVSDKGLFVNLGRNVTAWIKIADLSDSFVKEWKVLFKVDQLVEGKIVAVDQTLGHIQMSLRPSAISGKTKKEIPLSKLKKRQIVTGKIKKVMEYGVFIEVDDAGFSGLCHKSQMADGMVDDVSKLYAEGDPVKAIILKVDLEKRRVSFGLKASFFADQEDSEDDEVVGMQLNDNEGEEEEEEDSEDSSDGGVDLENVKDFDSDAENSDNNNKDSDAEIENGPKTSGGGLKAGGFDWTASILDKRGRGSDSDDSDSDEADKEKHKRKRKKSGIKQDLTGDLASRDPQSVSDFERMLLGEPNESRLWIQYMAFQLQLSEVEKAREIAERALKTIAIREEKEKMNIWIALLNMENSYGTDESLEEVFKRACQYNDAQEIYERLCSIYIQSSKPQKADDLFKAMTKKFSQDPRVWLNHADFLATNNNHEAARDLLKRAMQSLPKEQHKHLITKFAKLEFKTGGDPERGRTLFENLLGTYNKKHDLWNLFLDAEIKYATSGGGGGEEKENVRALFKRALAPENKCTPHQAKGLFKKWIEFEKKIGDGKGVDAVTRRAKEFVEARKRDV